MANTDVPTPGQVEFSADEERAMRQSSAANRESAGGSKPEGGWGARLVDSATNLVLPSLPIKQAVDHISGSDDEE